VLESYAAQPQDAIVPAFLTLGGVYFVAMMCSPPRAPPGWGCSSP
jgi:hypothetical protein